MNTRPTVIALFDALGSSARMESYPLSQSVELLEMLSDLTREKRDCLIIDAMVDAREQDDGTIVSGSAIGVLDVQNDSFSDTAILWSIFDRARFWTFCDLISEFFCRALEKEIPLRGGISVGIAHMDKNKSIYVGKPMAEVARVEKAQSWIGISFGPSFNQEPFKHYFHPEHVLDFMITVKQDKLNTFQHMYLIGQENGGKRALSLQLKDLIR